ncbi:MAG: J domain-containing protein [Acidobacteria bacterium]|nr:J domain-containing protein [Acidobacteriota bacterium]
MSPSEFVDYYELLQVSPNAEADTIQRVFRLLAQRYHPDNKDTGNDQLFQQLLKAYQTLSDPAQRAAFDGQHRSQVKLNWQIFDKEDAPQGREAEYRKREGILSVLYRKRQFTPNQPGMNLKEIEDLLGVPREHLEFTIWYLKERGEIRTADNGRFGITVKGVERFEELSSPESERPNLYMLPPAKSSRAV